MNIFPSLMSIVFIAYIFVTWKVIRVKDVLNMVKIMEPFCVFQGLMIKFYHSSRLQIEARLQQLLNWSLKM